MFRDDFETERPGAIPRREVARSLWPVFRPWIGHFVGAFLLLLVTVGLQIAGPLLVKRAIDVDISGRDLRGLRVTVALYLAAQLAHAGLLYLMRNWLEWTGQGAMADLKRRLFAHLLRLPLAFHDRQPAGKLLARVENDTQALRMLFTTTSVMLAGDVILFAGMYTTMFIVSPRLAAVTAVVLPVLVGITVYFQKRVHPFFLESRRLLAEISGRLAEFIQGIGILRAFERRRWAARHLQELNRDRYHAEFGGHRRVILWDNIVFLLQTVTFAIILGAGGYWALGGTVTIGTLAMFIGYVRRSFEPLLRLADQLATVQKAMAAAERILLILREPVAIEDPARPAAWSGLRGEIRFENVWFRYQKGAAAAGTEVRDDGWILRDVDFTIPAGQRWAIVGPTGSGKTTILSLLLRFYEPQRGRVLVDGIDVRRLAQEDLRRQLGLVLQDIYLFPGDLEANLTLGREVARERVREAARMTQADRVVARLPGGWHADLSERGANLSMGERQLLSFARAVLPEPSVLLLDEATSAVDPATEALIARGLERALEGRTAVIVAHRLSTIRGCHGILVVQGGRIVERGTHEELVASGGLYRTLHDLQFRAGGTHAA